MDMSLDDIIKTKKIVAGPGKKIITKKPSLALRKTLNRTAFKHPAPVRIADARTTIIQKNRSKIRDARDKLVEITRASGDARKKLIRKQLAGLSLRPSSKPLYTNGRLAIAELKTRRVIANTAAVGAANPKPRSQHRLGDYPQRSNAGGGGGGVAGGIRSRSSLHNIEPRQRSFDPRRNASRQLPDLITVPRGYVDYDNMALMEEEEYSAASQLSRTVKNENAMDDLYDDYHMSEKMAPPPPAPRHIDAWAGEHFDPFDVYDVPPNSRRERRIPHHELDREHDHQHELRHRERDMSPPPSPPPPKGILRQQRHSPDMYERRYMTQPSTHLSYEMRSRLERAPDPHASMGIFANPLHKKNGSGGGGGGHRSGRDSSPPSSLGGHRIVVSNLHTTVSQSDIRELFADIGDLYDSRIVRPGVAEVIYKSLGDAEKAVDTYHNRQLDGQPMKCLLVNARPSNKPTAPAIHSSHSAPRHASGKTPLEIDIDALHKVLFRRH